jgi:DNA-directed RNA polymerase subunit alpha
VTLSPMVTPELVREKESRNYSKFIISPLEQGYGVTLGNSLRRVLLSSLEGVAITSVRISEALHEFSDIPGVREDVLQVILQIKQIRLIMHEGDISHMHLDVKGEGQFVAGDIQLPSEIEIVNPELYLFTSDDPKSQLSLDFTVERGRGYLPVDPERSKELPIGELPVDAIFTPIKRVNYVVSSARVLQSTNYDRLEMEIWTDGTITPEKAMSSAAKTMIDQLRTISGLKEEFLTVTKEAETVISHLVSEAHDTPIENLDLSVRVFNSLKRTGITNVGDVIELLGKGDEAIMSIRNFGEKSLDELRQKMYEKGFIKDELDKESE